MTLWMPVVAIAFLLMAAAGTAVRVEVGRRANCDGRPLGTLAVNVAGSLALGVVASLDDPWLTVLGAGAIGALTTFSTFVAEVISLAKGERRGHAAIYVVATMGACIACAWLGLQLA